jgi:hypothetical protein
VFTALAGGKHPGLDAELGRHVQHRLAGGASGHLYPVPVGLRPTVDRGERYLAVTHLGQPDGEVVHRHGEVRRIGSSLGVIDHRRGVSIWRVGTGQLSGCE